MEVEITLKKEDWGTFQSFLENEISKSESSKSDSFGGQFVVWAFLGAAFIAVFQSISQFHWPTASAVAAVFAIIFGLYIYNLNKLKRLFAPSESGPFVGTHKFKINEEGIYSEGSGYKGFHSWSVVKRIIRGNGMIVVFIDTAFGYVFPESQLSNPDQFFQYANECNKGL